MGNHNFGVGYENHTSYPAPGQIILYPGGISETEILLAYGSVHFASKMGQLAGNHFLTIISGVENLGKLGLTVLWKGAQDIIFEAENATDDFRLTSRALPPANSRCVRNMYTMCRALELALGLSDA